MRARHSAPSTNTQSVAAGDADAADRGCCVARSRRVASALRTITPQRRAAGAGHDQAREDRHERGAAGRGDAAARRPVASATTAPDPSTPWLGTWASAAAKSGAHKHEQKAEREHRISS